MTRLVVAGAIVGATAVLGAACAHHAAASVTHPPTPAPPTAPAAPPPPAPRPPAPTTARPPAPLSEDDLFRRESLSELNAEHPLNDAFFDYDQNALRDDARSALQRDAAWLAQWPQTRVLIEGHCDERGTAEYNLALGDRRAEAVKGYLTSLGVAPDRLQVRSLGKEEPFCRDNGESCWAQNRRGHFVITAK